MHNQLTYLPEKDLWSDNLNCLYVKNEFDPDSPQYIEISREIWESSNAESYIDWSRFNCPQNLKEAAKQVLKKKLKTVNPTTYLSKYRVTFEDITSTITKNGATFAADNVICMLDIFDALRTTDNKIYFREIYGEMVNEGLLDAKHSVYLKLKNTKARKNIRTLKNVLNWHETKGALTQEEENLARNYVETVLHKNEKTFGVRLYAWLLFSTLKRGKQIRELKKDCLKKVQTKGIVQYFVQIKPVKGQTGDPFRWWPIPEALYKALEDYAKIPKVMQLQNQHDRFIFFPRDFAGQLDKEPAQTANSSIKRYFSHIISPRTKQSLVVTATRIRHTGATRLAFSGASRDIISEILEHDSPDSSQAYIDAIGSELCPSINAADRRMGDFFKELNNAYFNGEIADDLNNQPIMIPLEDTSTPNPLFVGSCGKNTVKEGNCKRHPFIGCYNGCPSFLAWREADHRKALQYVDTEIDRWSKATTEESTSTIKEFESVRDNILEVIRRIDNLASNQEVMDEH